MSVFAAVTASFIKLPADNGMLSHAQYLPVLLDSRVLTAICWTDTLDMVVDGATKGSIDRRQLHTCMNGTNVINHEIKLWTAKGKLHSIDLASAPAAISSALIFHSLQVHSFSSSPSERMASAISAEQVPMKVEPEELPDASGTRQGETEPGVFDLLPRSEKRPFHSPLYRKGFTMETEVDIAKELERTSWFK